MPYYDEFGRDGFQYICSSCNPNVVVGISRSLMFDDLFKHIWDNDYVRKSLQQSLMSHDKRDFIITTDDIQNLIGT